VVHAFTGSIVIPDLVWNLSCETYETERAERRQMTPLGELCPLLSMSRQMLQSLTTK